MLPGRLVFRLAIVVIAVWLVDASFFGVSASAVDAARTAGRPAASLPRAAKTTIADAYGRLPIAFRPNQGQLDPSVRFSAGLSAGGLFLTDEGATLSLPGGTEGAVKSGVGGLPSDLAGSRLPSLDLPVISVPAVRRSTAKTVVRLVFSGASGATGITGADPLPGTANYLLGSDPSKWHVGVPGYASVVYSGVYPGVDVVYRASGSNLEYDFVVAPGAAPDPITMSYSGAGRALLRGSGEIAIGLPRGDLVQRVPVAFQMSGGLKQLVSATYVDRGGDRFGLSLGLYDHSRQLVIDPVLLYSSYLGGNGFDAAYAVSADAGGNAYVAGLTTSIDFPGTSGPPTAGGNAHAFVSKINAAGNALVYSTYIGGTGNDEALGLALDGAGDVYLTGATTSADFPVASAAYPLYAGGADAFVVKLGPSGAGFIYSSYLGGNSYDIGYSVAVDPTQNVYVAGLTSSSNFPIIGGLGLPVAGGHSHAFVAKFNANGSAGYSTFLGGSADDGAAAISVDWLGQTYVTGITTSADFPLLGALQRGPGGSGDAFLTKLNPSGSALVFSTYLGGGGYDEGLAIALDQSDDVFVTGVTTSTNFPLTAPWQSSMRGSADAFITKIHSSGGAIDYSTYLGGAGTDVAFGIGLDWSGNAYVAGVTSSADFPNVYGNQRFTGTSDGFLSVITPGGAIVAFSTFLGGSADNQVRGLAVDSAGNSYLAGTTTSTDFPTNGGFQPAKSGSADAFVVKMPGVIPASGWTSFLADNHHVGSNPTQQLLNRGTAPSLRSLWADKVGGFITTQVVVGNGLEFFGSWDGYERAADPSGQIVWSTYLGVTVNQAFGCLGGAVGIASIGSLVNVGAGSVLYVGGGDAAMYALDAMTGRVLWRTSLGAPPAQFLWSSPAVSGGSVYEGVASFQECPAVQGQLVQMDAITGAIQHVFKTVPDGCTGAPVLASPAIDETEGVIYTATGNSPNSCPGPYDVAIVKLRASDLTVLDSWQIPTAEQVIADPDFGASPMLFNATIGGSPRLMVGLLNKNGTYYAFDRQAIGAGPVWRATNIGVAGNCPVCGSGSPISPSAYDGSSIYVGSNQTTIAGVTCVGSVRALNPATGAFIWEKCLSAPVLGGVSVSQGVAVVGAGPDIIVMSTADGTTLFTFHDPNPAPAPLTGTAKFWASPSIGQGVVYMGNVDGMLFALSL